MQINLNSMWSYKKLMYCAYFQCDQVFRAAILYVDIQTTLATFYVLIIPIEFQFTIHSELVVQLVKCCKLIKPSAHMRSEG